MSCLLINLNFTSFYSYFALYCNYYFFYSHFISGFCCASPLLTRQLLSFSNLYVFHLYKLFKSHTSPSSTLSSHIRHLVVLYLDLTFILHCYIVVAVCRQQQQLWQRRWQRGSRAMVAARRRRLRCGNNGRGSVAAMAAVQQQGHPAWQQGGGNSGMAAIARQQQWRSGGGGGGGGGGTEVVASLEVWWQRGGVGAQWQHYQQAAAASGGSGGTAGSALAARRWRAWLRCHHCRAAATRHRAGNKDISSNSNGEGTDNKEARWQSGGGGQLGGSGSSLAIALRWRQGQCSGSIGSGSAAVAVRWRRQPAWWQRWKLGGSAIFGGSRSAFGCSVTAWWRWQKRAVGRSSLTYIKTYYTLHVNK